MTINNLIKISPYLWELPKNFIPGMRVPGRIYADSQLLEHIVKDQAFKQVANVATLPGIVGFSLAMPDIHWGYGFPIGGVAAMDVDGGIVSPGGVGYDINCGVRLVKTDLTIDDVKPKLKQVVDRIFADVPCGVGSTGKIKLSRQELDSVLQFGAKWAVQKGYGWSEDIESTEDYGQMTFADPDVVSQRARERGHDQLGTLGSGNHFLEVQVVKEIFDKDLANAWGIFPGQITVMIHCGSRGLGHQICDEFEHALVTAINKYKISVPDKQLACTPINSTEGKRYLGAMASAANFAWANRQIIMHWVRGAFEKVFNKDARNLGMKLIYDVAHNIAKFEEHMFNNRKMKLLVHRKGATRAFPANHPDLPAQYKSTGQPVIIPGDMGRTSYLLVGTERAMNETFGSTCHGAGRFMSRHEAIRATRGRRIDQELAQKGIYIRWEGKDTLAEEVPEAYKDVSIVVNVVQGAEISRKVAKMEPLGVVKG